MKSPLGFYFRAVSPFNAAPLLVVLTKSHNRKTGAMIQTWILDATSDPLAAVRSGADASVCGECVQRPITGGRCYVAVARAPLAIWKAFHRGRYQPINPLEFYNGPLWKWARGASWRLGAYGDPAMVSINAWRHLLEAAGAPGWTGYSHQWLAPWAQQHKALCMASVETEGEAQLAQSMGWRTFRTVRAKGPLRKNEFACPASEEQGKRLTCDRCLACNGIRDGRDAKRVASVVIIEHGFRVKKHVSG